MDDYAWHSRNSGKRAHAVGEKAPNPWGLFDMYGNLWEWCSDWQGSYAEGEAADPQGPPAGTGRVLRGGDWYTPGRRPRSAGRHSSEPTVHFSNVGFRVALALPDAWRLQGQARHGPPVRDALVLYYPFDEAGERAEDKSGKGNHGKAQKAKWTPNGKIGGAYEFDGKTSYIQRDYDERSEVFPTDTPFSVAAWFRTSGRSPREPAVWGTCYTGVGDGYFLLVSMDDLGGRCRSIVISAERDGEAQSRRAVNDGRWHHAVGTWNGEQGSLYLDGVLQSSHRAAGATPYTHRSPFRIGHLHSSPRARAEDYYFSGLIDEVMVFNRALSAAEVKTLFGWEPKLGAMAAPRKVDVKALLAAGFDVPGDAKDRYGNPIRKGKDEQAEAPLEIRHKKTGMHFVFIPAGEFMMGGPPHERERQNDEGPVHKVRITKPFYLGKYEVTVGDFKLFSKDSRFTTDAERMKYGRAWQGADWVHKPDANWRNPYFTARQASQGPDHGGHGRHRLPAVCEAALRQVRNMHRGDAENAEKRRVGSMCQDLFLRALCALRG